MKVDAPVNSLPWWEHYFAADWQRHGGPDQTRHFMQRLLAAVPALDRALLAEEPLTILDWGCAMGDGCAELAKAFPLAQVTGLDAAETALATARVRFPMVDFQRAALDAAPGRLPRQFDLVVNSNSIEHFAAPLEVVRANLAGTRLLQLTLVPYREQPLAVHHLASFDEGSFPDQLAGFKCLFARVVEVDPAFWPSGKQLLVAYASPEYVARQRAFERSFSERRKWDAYYTGLPLAEVDASTQAFNAELLDVVRELLPGRGRVLEAGCGGGTQSLTLAQAGFDVTLLDFSQAALDYARRNLDHHGVPASYVRDDAFAQREAAFDLVFNAGVLEHYTLDEQARFLRGMASRSRRYVLVLIPNRACYWYWLWRVRKVATGDWPFGKEVPQTTLADAFAAAGLHYLGECFLGAAWSESFIESFDGIDAGTRKQLLDVHRSAVVPAAAKGYLLAALGTVDKEAKATSRWRDVHAAAGELRSQEQWTAMLADALAGRIGTEQQLQARRAELDAERAAHAKELDAGRAAHANELDAERAAHANELAAKNSELTDAESCNSALQLQLAQRLDELNVVSGRLMESQRQLQETSEWSRRTEIRNGEMAERLRVLEDADRRRFSRRMGRLYRFLTTQPPHQWVLRLYQRLPLSPERRHRIGVILNQWLARGSQMQSASGPSSKTATPNLRPDTGTDVFVFGIIDWHFRIQRPQQMARALAQRGHRVFYLSNDFIDDAQPGFAVEALDDALPLYQIRLHVRGVPPIYFGTPDEASASQMRAGLARLLLAARTARSLALVQHPYWWDLSGALPNATFVYDCMDHHQGFGNVPESMLALENRVIEQADAIIVTSQWLADRLRPQRPDTVLIRNACDYAFFATPPARVERDAAGRKTIGYFGAIAEWFDVDLIRAVARAYPETCIRLIGNDTVGARAQLGDCANVELTGELPYAALPAHLHGFDVCLLPFRKMPVTLATNPVKVYEYLAAGKPVVAVDLPEIAQFDDLVAAAQDADEYVAAAGRALYEDPQADARSRRQAFAQQQTWALRAAALSEHVARHVDPRVSIVVLTYNNLALTQACLASVECESDYANLELILVDNASTDGTRVWLREYAAARPDVKLIINDSNHGFAGGNNQGLAQASGEFLVVLNNDTVVTRGWVRTLVNHFRRTPKLGVLGPVTNNIGNEAKIDIAYADLAAMPAQAAAFTLAHAGLRTPLRTAAFFCVMLRRAAYARIGGLAQDYGTGFFEDDDYCRRAEAAGWEIACAEDVFIHHELSATFSKMPVAERERLWERNKAIYESRWGKWEPHRYRSDSPAAR